MKFEITENTPAGLATPLVQQARELARRALAGSDDVGRRQTLSAMAEILADVEEVLAGRLTPAERAEPKRSTLVLRGDA